jgi:manganese transport system permease protein
LINLIIDLIFDPLQFMFMQRALLAAVLVGVICAVVGSFLLVKRWALLGDAISHAVLPGVVLGYAFLGGQFFIGAIATGLLTAVGIGYVERNSRIKEDAAMGLMFIGAFALGLALISIIRIQVDLFHILFGNVLGVSQKDMLLMIGTGIVVLLAVALFYKELQIWTFDPVIAQAMGFPVRGLHYMMMILLSLTIVASLQAVGIVLVIAMLIAPAATAYLLTHRLSRMITIAIFVGVFSGISGLYLSYYLNIASGATMVLVSLFLFGLAFFFSPDQGIVLRWFRKIRNQKLEELEDAVKAIWTLNRAGKLVTSRDLAQQMGISSSKARNVLGKLDKADMVHMSEGVASLTDGGDRRAIELIRSHRLWERYLVDVGVLDWDEVHEEAHRLEHTPTDLIEGLAEKMGFPETDPHGAPIPGRKGELPTRVERSLTSLGVGKFAYITRIEDEPPAVVAQLKVLGLKPGVSVKVLAHENGALRITVESDEQIHLLAREVAENVWINTD